MAGTLWEVYGRAINAPFHFDDAASVVKNPSIVRLWPLIGDSEHRGPLNPPKDAPISGRPLTNLAMALNYHFGRLDPLGYHIFNLVVHLLSAMLLMAIVRRTLCLDYFAGRFTAVSPGAPGLAFIVALLWAVHPLQTETVVYITQRTELMVGFFYLATLYCSLRYWTGASAASRALWASLAAVACLAGVGCKEVMVSAPVVVLLFERTFITPGAPGFRRTWRNSWPLYLGLALSWVLLLGLNYASPRSLSAGFHLGVPAVAWWFTQTKIFVLYLRLAFWPWPLSIHYEIPYLHTFRASWSWLVPTLLFIAATLVLLWKRNPLGFLGAWILLILSPTLIVPIVTEVAAERRMYLPLAALAALVVVGGYWLIDLAAHWFAARTKEASTNRWPVAIVATITLLLAVVLSVASALRAEAYNDPVQIWESALASQPADSLIHTNLGIELANKQETKRAKDEFREAIRLAPNRSEAYFDLGLVLAAEDESQEAIQRYQQALKISPNYPEAEIALAATLTKVGRTKEGLEHYRQAYRLRPDYPETSFSLALALRQAGQFEEAVTYYQKAVDQSPNTPELLNSLAITLIDAGRPQEAIERLTEALRLMPYFAEAHCNLGVALANVGKLPEAIDQYREALKLKPDYAEAHNNLGNALLKSQRPQEAIPQFEDALRLKPDYVDATNNLGNALMAADRPEEAIARYRQTLRLQPKRLQTYSNLTAAYARLQRSAEAIASAEEALSLARSLGQSAAAQQIETWLTNYRADQNKARDATPNPPDTRRTP